MERLPKYIRSSQGKLWLTEDERDNLKISYRIKNVLFEETSPYQHVMVLDSYDFGPMLVLDGVVQTTSMDGYIYNEMISHVPLSFHPHPRNVLIIGGGDCGAAKEAAKYEEVERIDLVEIDEAVVRASKRYMPEVSGNLSDPSALPFCRRRSIREASPKQVRCHHRRFVRSRRACAAAVRNGLLSKPVQRLERGRPDGMPKPIADFSRRNHAADV